jgi:hypothetical protein
MLPNEQEKHSMRSQLHAFGTMALVVQLLRSVKERCAQETEGRGTLDATAPVDEMPEVGSEQAERALDKPEDQC